MNHIRFIESCRAFAHMSFQLGLMSHETYRDFYWEVDTYTFLFKHKPSLKKQASGHHVTKNDSYRV